MAPLSNPHSAISRIAAVIGSLGLGLCSHQAQAQAQALGQPFPSLGPQGHVVVYTSLGPTARLIRDSIEAIIPNQLRIQRRRPGSEGAISVIYTRTPDGIFEQVGGDEPLLLIPAQGLKPGAVWRSVTPTQTWRFSTTGPVIDTVMAGVRTTLHRVVQIREFPTRSSESPSVVNLLLSADLGVVYSRSDPGPTEDDAQFVVIEAPRSSCGATCVQKPPAFCRVHNCGIGTLAGVFAAFAETARPPEFPTASTQATAGIELGFQWLFLATRLHASRRVGPVRSGTPAFGATWAVDLDAQVRLPVKGRTAIYAGGGVSHLAEPLQPERWSRHPALHGGFEVRMFRKSYLFAEYRTVVNPERGPLSRYATSREPLVHRHLSAGVRLR